MDCRNAARTRMVCRDRFEAALFPLLNLKYFHLYCRNWHFAAHFCSFTLPAPSGAPNPFEHLIGCLTMTAMQKGPQ